MSHIKPKVLVAFSALLLGAAVQAATVQVQWGDTENYRDIRSVDSNQNRFEERVMRELEEQFRREAARLPADQNLNITVRDLDLAGEIEYFHARHPFGLRVIRRVDFPSLALSYELTDANAQVLKAGETEVKDMGFRFTTLMPIDRSPLRYEKAMISEWYRDTLR